VDNETIEVVSELVLHDVDHVVQHIVRRDKGGAASSLLRLAQGGVGFEVEHLFFLRQALGAADRPTDVEAQILRLNFVGVSEQSGFIALLSPRDSNRLLVP